MSELSGEKIERLLWEAGCEVRHNDGMDEVSPISVVMGDTTVVISEAWFEEGNWFLDTDTFVLEKQIYGEKVDEDLSFIEDEVELVKHILTLGGEL